MPFDGVAPAVVNAIRSLGIDMREIPATPERVMDAPMTGTPAFAERPAGRLRRSKRDSGLGPPTSSGPPRATSKGGTRGSVPAGSEDPASMGRQTRSEDPVSMGRQTRSEDPASMGRQTRSEDPASMGRQTPASSVGRSPAASAAGWPKAMRGRPSPVEAAQGSRKIVAQGFSPARHRKPEALR